MILDRFRVDGKVAIVSGAGVGIGRACALALAEMGAHVVCAARTARTITDVAAEARLFGNRALAVPCDVTVPAQLEDLVAQTVREFGRIDILINNVGGNVGGGPTPTMDLTLEDFEATLRLNLSSAFLLTQLVVPHMVKDGGTGVVVNNSSAAWRFVESGFLAYSTAKAALCHMTRLHAYEFAPRVRVNAVAAGSIENEKQRGFGKDFRSEVQAIIPLGHLGTPEDIALAVLYLATPASSFVTGAILDINGGIVSSPWPAAMKIRSGLYDNEPTE